MTKHKINNNRIFNMFYLIYKIIKFNYQFIKKKENKEYKKVNLLKLKNHIIK